MIMISDVVPQKKKKGDAFAFMCLPGSCGAGGAAAQQQCAG